MGRRSRECAGFGVTVVGLLLLAGCTETPLAEPNVQPSAGAHTLESAEAPAGQATPEPATPVVTPTAPASAANDAEATKPFAFDAPSQPLRTALSCRFDGLVLPANTKVYAAGAYAGREANFQIDQSGHQATTLQVAVHEPNAPVALLLGAYEPTVWSIGWTRQTQIVAVLVTGYHRQQLTGLPDSVPLLVSTYDNRGPCGYAYVGGEGSARLNTVAREVFGRPVDVAYAAQEGRAVVGKLPPGASLVTDAAAKPVEAFQQKDAPLAGQAGIDAAIRAGTLRPATEADMNAWNRARGAAGDVPRIVGGDRTRDTNLPYRSYTVLKAFAIPAGLYGANSATFFVTPGVPAPTGNPGHSEVRFIENGSCVGATCGRR